MDDNAKDSKELLVDKEKFDAVLRKIIRTKPMPLKDVIGTTPRGKASNNPQATKRGRLHP